MTQESIEARISELTRHRDKLLAELNQVEGAILDCQYWNEKLAHPSPTDLSANEKEKQ